MTGNIRGIECSLDNDRIEDLLLFFCNTNFDFYIQRCMKVDSKRTLLPTLSQNFRISSKDLEKLAKESIWELVLHIYPIGSNMQAIDTYNTFMKSECLCCLIFYDCSLMDLYVKDSMLRNCLYNLLLTLDAKDMSFITDQSDGRTHLSV